MTPDTSTISPAERPRRHRWPVELCAVATVIALILTAATWIARPRLAFAAASQDARRYLGDFWEVEHNGVDSYRWSRADAFVRLFGMEQQAPLLISARLSASRPLDRPLIQLTIEGAGAPIRFPIARGWRRYVILAPVPARGAEAPALTLHSLVDPPYPESRDLGVALSWLRATANPVDPVDRLPAAGRLAFLTLLGLLLYTALRRRVALWVARLAVLVLALALGAGIAVAPGQVAYGLPSMWLALLLGWLLLLLPPLVRALRRRAATRQRDGVAGALVAIGSAQALLPLQQPWTSLVGWALLVGGCALLIARLPEPPPRDERPIARHTVAVALGAIVALALALRLVALDGLPPGMWRDEARHGLLALRILRDPVFRPVYVAGGADIPALLFYLAAAPIGLFGAHPWTVRLVPALAGALTPLALYFMARPLFGARTALLAAALLATSVWHLSLSRLAFAATLGPPLTLLAIGGLWRALHGPTGRARRAAAILTGCATGAAVYAYHPSRLTPLVLALITLILLGRDTRAWRQVLPRLLVAAVVAVVVAWPLARYALGDAAGFGRRVNQTSIFNADSLAARAPAARVEQNIRLNLGLWNERGDGIARHNLSGAPQLDPVGGALFALGVGLALAWWRDRRARLLLIWLAVTLIPGLFSIEAPHAVRTVEAIAPSMLLAGLGAAALLRRREGRRPWPGRARWAPLAAVGALVLVLNAARYFVVWPAAPETYQEFYVAETHIGELAQALARMPATSDYRVVIATANLDRDVIAYLTSGTGAGTFDGSALAQPPGERALLIVSGDLPPADVGRARAALGVGASELGSGPPAPPGGHPEFVIYGRGAQAAAIVAQALGRRAGNTFNGQNRSKNAGLLWR